MTKQAKQQKIVIGHPTVLIDLAKSVSRKNNNGSDIISTIRKQIGAGVGGNLTPNKNP